MLSKRGGIIIAVVVLLIFSGLTVGTIEKSSTNLTASPSSSSKLSVYSPSNGTIIPLTSPNATIKLNLSINSSSSSVYIFPISPSSPVTVKGVELLSMPGLVYLNKSVYPYDYELLSVKPDTNFTAEITLYVNSSAFQEMKVSSPTQREIYPYLVEILVETSGSAAAIAFTVIRL
jgi:hypothetical protein